MKTIISKAAWFISCLLLVLVNLSLAQNALYEKTGLNFDGVNDYVQVSNGAVFPELGTYTMQAFVKFDAIAATGYRNIFYNGNSAANGWGLYTFNGKLSVIVGGKAQYNTTSFTPVTGKWYHMALKSHLARDGNGAYYGYWSVWVDGVNVTPVVNPIYGQTFYVIDNRGLVGVLNPPAANDGIFIGGRAGGENLAATIDQVSIYQSDVNYNDANCLLSPALRAYTFEEGTANGNNVGKSVTDRSGNNKTGTLFNFSLTDPGGKSNYTNGVVSIGSNARLYVNKNATGSNTGESWENAMTNLSDALALSCSRTNQEIWIAEGTYKPDRDWYGANNGRKNTFYVKANLKIYGGFMGNETDLNKRMPGHNTILSGNLGDESTAEDNSFHVMFVRDGLNSVLLDGLVIQMVLPIHPF